MVHEDLKEQLSIAVRDVLSYATKVSRTRNERNHEILPISCLQTRFHVKANVDPRGFYTINLVPTYHIDEYSPWCIDGFLKIESVGRVAEQLAQSNYVDPLRQLLGLDTSETDKALSRAMVHIFLALVNIYIYRHGLEFHREYFERVYVDFANTFMSDTIELVFVAPLENFRPTRHRYDQTVADMLELSKNVRVRRLEDFEVSKYVASFVFPRDLMFSSGEVLYDMPLVSHGVEVIQGIKRRDLFKRRFEKVLIRQGQRSIKEIQDEDLKTIMYLLILSPEVLLLSTDLPDEIGDVITSLRLLKSGNIGCSCVIFYPRRLNYEPFLFSFTTPQISPRYLLPEFYFLDDDRKTRGQVVKIDEVVQSFEESLNTLKEYTEKLKALFNTLIRVKKRLPDNVKMSIEWFNKSYLEEKIEYRLLDLAIALETLYGRGDRLDIYVPKLIGETREEMLKISKNVKKLRKARGSIVHSGRCRGLTREFVETIEEYYRASARKVLELLDTHETYESIMAEIERSLFCPQHEKQT